MKLGTEIDGSFAAVRVLGTSPLKTSNWAIPYFMLGSVPKALPT